uniref:Endoplasmic reticulum lectin n=1 Tax=Callorhinchus milii TaxID=7868 RepID=V9KAV9_CALMI
MKFQQDAEDEGQSYTGLGVAELLKPMDAAPCLIKTKDWWTYEFCYGQYIKQYHIEDSEVKGEVLYLGIYESEFDWNNETAKASKQHKLKRYHSQTYVNGSKCDLNEKPREAEVRFLCEEGSGDYLARVDEPQSCSYVLTVHTTRICHHPYLRSPVASKPQPIKCQPALSPEQYVEYVKAQVSDTKRKVEKISEELKTLDEMLLKDQPVQTEEDPQSAEAAEGESLTTGEEQGESQESTMWVDEGVPSDSREIEEELWVGDGKQEVSDGAMSQEGGNEEAEPAEQVEGEDLDDSLDEQGKQKIKFRLIRNPEDFVKFVRELKKQNKKRKGEDQDLTPEQSAGGTEEQIAHTSTLERLEEGVDDEEGQLLEEFEKQLQDVTLPKSKMSEIKREVKEEMEKEIATLIDEAEGELEAEGLKGEFDHNQATKSLASTLNKLIEKLETKEEEEEEEEEKEISEGLKQEESTPSLLRERIMSLPLPESLKAYLTYYRQK